MLSEPGLSSKIAELESELREISCELAGSIRREMELEDLVERLQTEVPTDSNRRTSDYFSDSGTSSVRYGSDSASRVEDIEKIKRAAEQERAQLKVQLSQKWQEERAQRTASESHVQILENQVQQVGFAVAITFLAAPFWVEPGTDISPAAPRTSGRIRHIPKEQRVRAGVGRDTPETDGRAAAEGQL